jgi:hypothetical protein
MHFALKLFFFVFAVEPGFVYLLLDFCVTFNGLATEVFSALSVLYSDVIMIYLRDASQ